MLKVTTMEGMEMVINEGHIVIAGPVSVDNVPMVGMTKVLFVNGASVVVKIGLDELLFRATRA